MAYCIDCKYWDIGWVQDDEGFDEYYLTCEHDKPLRLDVTTKACEHFEYLDHAAEGDNPYFPFDDEVNVFKRTLTYQMHTIREAIITVMLALWRWLIYG